MPDSLFAALADRYRVERELGAGGMATVYLARDLRHDREVALKVLRPELGAVLGAERFLAEIRITARLQHPHILTLIDSGAVDGFLFYVLPLVRGESLRARLERERQLELEEALRIATQVAGALDYAHRQGVIHRDVKPENILLHEGEAMLTDFGIALAVSEAGGGRLTETGLSLGSPQYMSPEQAAGERTLDARSDVYSLGAVLYEMLAGEPPVTGPSAQAMIAKLMTQRPVRLSVVRPAVPAPVDVAVDRALSKTPADRFPTAAAFAQALAARSVAGPTRKPSRVAWIAAAAAGVILIAVGAVLSKRTHRPASAAPAFVPRLDQLTTDGNARSPALSPDGTRLAYVARDCDEHDRCNDRLVVRDIGGAASVTLLSGGSLDRPAWATDGRFVVVTQMRSAGTRVNVAVPSLGGAPRTLPGSTLSVVGTSDTVLTGSLYVVPNDSVSWLQLVTVSDGVVRDSVPVHKAGLFMRLFAAPAGGRIALLDLALASAALRVVDRAGRVVDSIPGSARPFASASWTPNADALLLQVMLGREYSPFAAQGVSASPSAIVRRRVGGDGRFVGPLDTLLRLDRGSEFTMSTASGSALLSQGPIEAEVYAFERSKPGRLDFRVRRLTTSTAGLRAHLSRDGRTVLLRRGVGAVAPRRNTFMPFEGGTERPVELPPGLELSLDFSTPVSDELLYAVRDSAGHARLAHIDVATGATRRTTDLPAGTAYVFSLSGGGYGAGLIEPHAARVMERPGKADTTWTAANVPGRMLTAPGGATPDGRAFYEYSQTATDTVFVRRVPLDGSAPSAPLPIVFDQWFSVFTDGSFELLRGDSTGGFGWYRIARGAVRSERLGNAPIQTRGTSWDNSEDGRRFIAVKPVFRPDAYVITNFGELLKR